MLAMTTDHYHYLTTGDAHLDRLRVYLSDWQEWEQRFRVDLGVPNAAAWSKYMDGQFAEVERSDGSTINVEAMRIIDRGMDELAQAKPELSIAIRWRYLNINVDAHVFRFKRLAGLSLTQLDDMADEAERELLPIVKRKGLVL